MIKNLISLRLRAAFLASLSGKDKKGNPKGAPSAGKIVGYTLLYIFLALIFLFAVFSMAMGMAIITLPAAPEAYFGIFMLASLAVIFVLSIFETKAELFDCKDNELLLAMPIKSSDIAISRIFTVVIFNYIIEAVIMIPSVVVYFIFGGNFIGAIGSLIVFLTIPLLATALSSGVGYLVALLTRKIKHKNLLTVIFSVAFMALYFVGYMAFMASSFGDESLDGENPDYTAILAALRPFAIIGGAQMLSPIPLLILIAITALAVFLAYYFISKHYISIITDSHGTSKVVYVEKRSTRRSSFSAIVRKEFARITSSSTYMLNGGMGIILALVLAGLLIFNAGEFISTIELLIGMPGVNTATLAAPMLIAAIIFCSDMILFSCSTISLESKNLWIIKSMPLNARDILLAKTVPHIVIGTSVTLVSSVAMAIATGAPALYYIFYILIPPAVNVAYAFLGILLNILWHKFDYTNEMQAVKQSLPVFLITFVGMFISLGILLLSFIAALLGQSLLFLTLTLVFFLALSFAFYLIIVSTAAKRFDKIQV